MTDFKRILAVKQAAQSRLLAIPGVHSVAIGAKRVAGKSTNEPAIAVFVVKKKDPSEIPAGQLIPSQIEGIPTDVVEEQMPRLLAGGLPDIGEYDVMEGGIQIQAGTSVTGAGTLGFIARTDEPDPKIVGVTCHHVFAFWDAQPNEILIWTSPDKHEVIIYGTNVAGTRVRCWIQLLPTGGGTPSWLGPFDWMTTNADTLTTIASSLVAVVNTPPNPNVTVTANGGRAGDLRLVPGPGFDAQFLVSADILWVDTTPTKVITFSGSSVPGLVVRASLTLVPMPTGDLQDLDVFYVTVAGDTPTSIANAVAGVINGFANPGVTAAGPINPNGSEVTITSGANFVAAFTDAGVFKPMEVDPASRLKAAVAKATDLATGGFRITLTGQAASENYGIYTNVNAGGQAGSYGLFFQPLKDDDLTTLATRIAGELTSQNIPLVTITASGPVITLAGAEEVECIIASDIRVGQPVHTFSDSCCKCGDRRIGRILDARLGLDTAALQFDPGVKYKAEIEGIGVVSGDHEITDDEALAGNYAVKKRGRTTGLTNGTIAYLHADGDIATDVFQRHYTDCMKITGNKFSAGGDSGSAVLNSANEVVGILFGGSDTVTYATPIQTVTNALELIVETATVANDVKTVPAPAAHAMSMEPSPAAIMGARNAAPFGLNWDRLRQAEQELASVPAGRKIAAAVRRHFPETQSLINRNRRIATVWHRNGGSQILHAILRMAQSPNQHLPLTINGKPLVDCLRKIQNILLRYGSSELSADLKQHWSWVEQSLTLNYSDLIVTLRSESGD